MNSTVSLGYALLARKRGREKERARKRERKRD
jgi:hypothetical protein